MKKLVVLGMGLCLALSFSSCKSSESAYKKAYEKAKQQELATQPTQQAAPVETVVATPVQQQSAPAVNVGTVREEKVQLVSGAGLKAYNVVCGSFGVKANADALKEQLAAEGYKTLVVENVEAPAGAARYRVIVGTFDDRASAAAARDAFKAKYPNRSDFQGAWLLYRIK
jgi:cell division protein FtsN